LKCGINFNSFHSAIGVDLGTTFSVVGINKNGKVIIIEDKFGHKIFPSVVSYKDNGGMLNESKMTSHTKFTHVSANQKLWLHIKLYPS
jgi:molecular chaperone DnaK (HSP70)